MVYYIGIRRETKPGERRIPLVPKDVKKLQEEHDIQTIIQPDDERVFSDEEFQEAGAIIKEDLSDCPVIFGIKEMDLDFFQPKKAYVCFHHVIKGQKSNMPMLKHMMDVGSTMIDYEKVVDENNRRLIFFGRHAGYAGMVDTLHGFGKRLLEEEGLETVFTAIKQAKDYFDLAEAKEAIKEVAKKIKQDGLPEELCPLVCGFIGYGNVSQGAQTIFDLLPHKEIDPSEVAEIVENPGPDHNKYLYKVVFKEWHLVEPKDPNYEFKLQDYYDNPEKYKPVFAQYLPNLTIIVNGTYWNSRYPRSITKEDLKELYCEDNPRLRIIGDISCDVLGGCEATICISYLDEPFYVYDPFEDTKTDGVKGKGPVILAIDHLPTEIPRDSSTFFSNTLLPYVPAIAKADYEGSFEDSGLPEVIKNAVILWHGNLTPEYKYLEKYL